MTTLGGLFPFLFNMNDLVIHLVDGEEDINQVTSLWETLNRNWTYVAVLKEDIPLNLPCGMLGIKLIKDPDDFLGRYLNEIWLTYQGHSVFLIDGNTVGLLENLNHIQDFLNTIPRKGAVHSSSLNPVGISYPSIIPLFGTYYDGEALRITGGFNNRIQDRALLPYEWSKKAISKGYPVIKIGGSEKIKSTPVTTTRPPETRVTEQRIFQGKQPWLYKTTVAILNNGVRPADVKLVRDLWQAQTEKPYIEIYDVSTGPEEIQELLFLENNNTEILNQRPHPYHEIGELEESVYAQMLVRCRTKHLLITDSLTFPKSPTLISELLSICDSTQPVIGYGEVPKVRNLTTRRNVSSSLLMLDTATMDRCHIGFHPRWMKNAYAGQTLEESLKGGLQTFNVMLKNANIQPKLIGNDESSGIQESNHFTRIITNPKVRIQKNGFQDKNLEEMRKTLEDRLRNWEFNS